MITIAIFTSDIQQVEVQEQELNRPRPTKLVHMTIRSNRGHQHASFQQTTADDPAGLDNLINGLMNMRERLYGDR